MDAGLAWAAAEAFDADEDADIIYGNCLIVDGDGRVLEHRRPPLWDLAYAVENCYHMIDQPAAYMRRGCLERIGWLYPAWFHDWDLWRRVALSGGKIKRVPSLLGAARIRHDNSQYNPRILIEGMVKLTERFFNLPGLSWDLSRLKRRALSNCYLKILQTLAYGRPELIRMRFDLAMKALRTDPTNYPRRAQPNAAGHPGAAARP